MSIKKLFKTKIVMAMIDKLENSKFFGNIFKPQN